MYTHICIHIYIHRQVTYYLFCTRHPVGAQDKEGALCISALLDTGRFANAPRVRALRGPLAHFREESNRDWVTGQCVLAGCTLTRDEPEVSSVAESPRHPLASTIQM